MQKQHLLKEQNGASLKEQNGASLKPETHTPSFALDFPVVVIDEMTDACFVVCTKGEAMHSLDGNLANLQLTTCPQSSQSILCPGKCSQPPLKTCVMGFVSWPKRLFFQ